MEKLLAKRQSFFIISASCASSHFVSYIFSMYLYQRFLLVCVLIVFATLYILPWNQFGVSTDFLTKPYTLGLDLRGGVELDYQVDLSAVNSGALATNTEMVHTYNETTIVEGLKKIIDRRVNSLGLAEPNIQTVRYGTDTHLIVQIPTQSYPDLSPEEQEAQRLLDIKNAKETIGRVVRLEFRERKTNYSAEDYAERAAIAKNAYDDALAGMPFETVMTKYALQYERIEIDTLEGEIAEELVPPNFDTVTEFPYLSNVFDTTTNASYTIDESGQPTIQSGSGYAVVYVEAPLEGGKYRYSYMTVDAEPSGWMPAKTTDGKVLNDQYLVNAGVSYTSIGQSQVDLVFNDEGKRIFAELTQRLIGQQIAIFVGGDMVTAPVVQSVIPDGRAVITGQSGPQESQRLADEINTGIVPAPIYLTSERTIDAKIGETALGQILNAGVIGLIAIVVFLTLFYRIGGLIAGIALIAYTIFLIAIVKYTGVVMTLASIAGVILSIGLAIDANILIFERTREALKEGMTLNKAIAVGFNQSWTAIWDSHITSVASALILYIFGIAMIKGFGLMLGIGIILSLFTAMWVSRVLIQVMARMIKNPKTLIGYAPFKK